MYTAWLQSLSQKEKKKCGCKQKTSPTVLFMHLSMAHTKASRPNKMGCGGADESAVEC